LASSVIVAWPETARERQLEKFFNLIARSSAQKPAQLQSLVEEAEAAKDDGAVH
jgi:hypothetical protein